MLNWPEIEYIIHKLLLEYRDKWKFILVWQSICLLLDFLSGCFRCNCYSFYSNGNCCCYALLILAVSVGFSRNFKQQCRFYLQWWLLGTGSSQGQLCSSPQNESALQIIDERLSSYYQHKLTKSVNKGWKNHSWNNCYAIWSLFSFVLNTTNFLSPLSTFFLFEAYSQLPHLWSLLRSLLDTILPGLFLLQANTFRWRGAVKLNYFSYRDILLP